MSVRDAGRVDRNDAAPGRLDKCSRCGARIRVVMDYGGGLDHAIIDPEPIPDDAADELVAVVSNDQGDVAAVRRADVAGKGLRLYRWHHDTCRRNRGVPEDPAEFRKYLGLPG